jgi:protein-S-isoprenylcysteine O-methyltransferase Ste14
MLLLARNRPDGALIMTSSHDLASLLFALELGRIAAMFDTTWWIDSAWLIFLLYWLVSAFRVNRMKRREPPVQIFGRLGLTILLLVLMYSFSFRWSVLNRPFVPKVWWLPYFAVALTWIGLAITIWARYHLGRFWSGTVALREDHQLIRSGPYARIRHPIYTGILMMWAGSILAVDRYRVLVVFVVLLAGIIWKASKEEALLAGEFGPGFDEHRRRTGFLFPRLFSASPSVLKYRRAMERAAHFAVSAGVVVLHCFGAVFVSFIVGFFPEGFVGERWYYNSPLEAFVPCMSAVAILLGILVARSSSLADKRAMWAWIPGLFWFGFGVHNMLLVGGVLQTGAWTGSTPFRFLMDNLFGGTPKCGDTECLDELIFTMPLVVSTAYSLASGITLRLRQVNSTPLANS